MYDVYHYLRLLFQNAKLLKNVKTRDGIIRG